MKKTNFLKIALTLVMAVAFIGVFGQAKEIGLVVDNATAHTVTINKAIPFYVTPDAYFNPGYVGPGWALAVGETWTWTFNSATLTGASMPVGAVPAIATYNALTRDITFDMTGNYVLAVREESPATCLGTIQLQSITVINRPDANFATLAGRDIEQCGTYTGAVPFTIVNNTATNFLVDYTLVVQNYLADKVTVDGAPISTTPNADVAFAAAGAQNLVASASYPIVGGKVTRYTFTITDINDAVSRVSSYVAPNTRAWPIVTYTAYAPITDAEYSIQVLPAPTTGPIFHLAN